MNEEQLEQEQLNKLDKLAGTEAFNAFIEVFDESADPGTNENY